MPTVSLSPRDRSLLRLLSWTPATTGLLWKASATFEGEPFLDERRLRERLQALAEAKIVRSWAAAHAGGGLQNYYKLTLLGFDLLFGAEAAKPPRAFFEAVSPSLFAHTFRLAEAIVATLRACRAKRVAVIQFRRENELAFKAGNREVRPDCFFRLQASGRFFNLAFEIDNGTEPLDSHCARSIREKLATYDAYQQRVLSQWLAQGKRWERPRFRVVFLTQSVARAYHILALAAETAANRSRRLAYAAALDDYAGDADPLFSPLFLDHSGRWRALIDPHPTAGFQRSPVRLLQPLESPLLV